MQAEVLTQQQQSPAILINQINSDQQAQDLFNQIQIDQQIKNINHEKQDLEDPSMSPLKKSEPKCKKKKFTLQLDSDKEQSQVNLQKQNNEGQKSLKKERKQQKKLRKLQKKMKRKSKKQKKLQKRNKLRKEADNEDKKSQSQQWSGESSQSLDQNSDVSQDSLLLKMNPNKKNNSSSKKISTQKKQGFSLKQLGNNAQVNYSNQQNLSDDSEYGRKKKKQKHEKKQVSKNLEILKSLIQKGLCVQQQNGEQNRIQDQIDNGLEQLHNMKNSKKKGPRIMNKLFAQLQVNEEEQVKKQPLPKQIQLQFKPKVNNGPSLITSSFLTKTQRLKKVRGMESQLQNQQFQKMMSLKAKQSMVKLINQKQLQQADQLQLDIKVPQIVKGSGQINNSIFLKKISSSSLNQNQNNQPINQEQIGDLKNSNPSKDSTQLKRNDSKTKVSRIDFFRSMSQQLKSKKSRQITQQVIKNSFKVTQLQEIQEMRRKNQQKRRRQALVGSDDEQDQDYQIENVNRTQDKDQNVIQNKLGFMNFKVELKKSPIDGQISGNLEIGKPQQQNMMQEGDVNSNNIEKNENQMIQNLADSQGIRKTKSFNIQIQKSIPDEKYKKLLLLQEQGVQQNEQHQNQQLMQILGNNEDDQEVNEQNEDQSDDEQQQMEDKAENQEEYEQINQKQMDEAERVDLQIQLEVAQSNSQQVQDQQDNQGLNQIQNQQQHVNQEYQQYLNELQAEGIQIKKHRTDNKVRQKKRIIKQEKQNDHLIQNKQIQEKLPDLKQQQQNQARRQFRKLRKFANILKKKKQIQQKMKKLGEFFEEQAQQGSDNQNHDNQVKKINYDQEEKQCEGIQDLDAQAQQLIDNAVDLNEQDQALAFRKFMEDVKIQDRQILKRIMKGDYKRRQDHEPMMDQLDQDQKRRQQRMDKFNQFIKQKQKEELKQLYMRDQNKQQNSEQQDEDSSNIDSNVRKNRIKKPIQATQQQYQEVDEMNEQNLKRYLDDGVAENYRTTIKVRKQVPATQLPQSYQRGKQMQMRNTMKPKVSETDLPTKLKKTSSHLNQMIMKNKQKIKPLNFIRGFPLVVKK